MAATSGFSMAQLIAIEEAIASGSDTVSYDGKSVKYRSIDELAASPQHHSQGARYRHEQIIHDPGRT